MKEAITLAQEKKFTEFNKLIKTSLEDKLRNNPIIQQKADEVKTYQQMKDIFSQIKK